MLWNRNYFLCHNMKCICKNRQHGCVELRIKKSHFTPYGSWGIAIKKNPDDVPVQDKTNIDYCMVDLLCMLQSICHTTGSIDSHYVGKTRKRSASQESRPCLGTVRGINWQWGKHACSCLSRPLISLAATTACTPCSDLCTCLPAVPSMICTPCSDLN